MDQVVVPVLLAVLGEALVFYADQFFVQKNLDWRLVAALVAGLVFAVGFDIDVFVEAGYISSIPVLGNVLTGVVFSRLMNLSHNFIEGLRRPDVTIEVPVEQLPPETLERLK